jgi:Asp-tRNA(Asn)/Glu-tRNA(Gln) amidotransferase A subunit family amidase
VDRLTPPPDRPEAEPVTPASIAAAMRLVGLDVTATDCERMVDGLRGGRRLLDQLRAVPLDHGTPLALTLLPPVPAPARPAQDAPPAVDEAPHAERPADLEDVAFWSVAELARLVRARRVSAVELTEMYLARLARLDPLLRAVVTPIHDLALAQARRADDETVRGGCRGPLHGIPWGVKDLVATRGVPTTWGAQPYRDRVIDLDATVVRRLEAAGAVLVAKLATGVLAVVDDYWFGGRTMNPWNPCEGASGSSAGPAAATAAGLVAYAIGTETLGSIMGPSARCGVTGLRPTYGRVSRHGVMPLAWTIDTVGPICRSAEDCALVFGAIHGPDGFDPTVVDRPFAWIPGRAVRGLRVGHIARTPERSAEAWRHYEETLAVLASLGATLVPITLPEFPYDALRVIVLVEAAGAFETLVRCPPAEPLVPDGGFDVLAALRCARLVPAVEYVQANRVRAQLIQAMVERMAGIDLYVRPNLADDDRLITSYTGAPAVAVPNGFSDAGRPVSSVVFVGHAYDEARLLAVAQAYQEATGFHRRHPRLP